MLCPSRSTPAGFRRDTTPATSTSTVTRDLTAYTATGHDSRRAEAMTRPLLPRPPPAMRPAREHQPRPPPPPPDQDRLTRVRPIDGWPAEWARVVPQGRWCTSGTTAGDHGLNRCHAAVAGPRPHRSRVTLLRPSRSRATLLHTRAAARAAALRATPRPLGRPRPPAGGLADHLGPRRTPQRHLARRARGAGSPGGVRSRPGQGHLTPRRAQSAGGWPPTEPENVSSTPPRATSQTAHAPCRVHRPCEATADSARTGLRHATCPMCRAP